MYSSFKLTAIYIIMISCSCIRYVNHLSQSGFFETFFTWIIFCSTFISLWTDITVLYILYWQSNICTIPASMINCSGWGNIDYCIIITWLLYSLSSTPWTESASLNYRNCLKWSSSIFECKKEYDKFPLVIRNLSLNSSPRLFLNDCDIW